MRNYTTTFGITALMLAPMSAYAHGPHPGESPEAHVTRMIELCAQEREADLRRQADDREGDRTRELHRARAREVSRLVKEVLTDADLRSSDLGAGTLFNLDPTVADARRFISLGAFQDEPSPAEGDGAGEGSLAQKADKTGTNPINFQFDFRLYHEYQYLNTAGSGSQNISTLEFRAPFADGKWQFRVKARGQVIEADLNGDGSDELDDGGLGDTDIRFLTVPVVNLEKKLAFAYALEIFLDTATDDALGSGATTLGPQVFLALFQPFGLPIDGFFPGYQHQFSVDGDDVHRSLIDLFVLKTWDNKRLWLLADPQIIVDYENDTEFFLLDLEFGMMLPMKGHSTYVRPSFGIGSDRPYDASLEVGYKIVW